MYIGLVGWFLGCCSEFCVGWKQISIGLGSYLKIHYGNVICRSLRSELYCSFGTWGTTEIPTSSINGAKESNENN